LETIEESINRNKETVELEFIYPKGIYLR